jgi:cold shock CspA family protein
MADSTPTQGAERHPGRVARLVGDYGFIHSPVAPGKDIYFHASWFRGAPPLKEGDEVTFEFRIFEGREQAHYVRRLKSSETVPISATRTSPETALQPVSGRLVDWAYLRHIPTALNQLAELALPERWEFKEAAPEPERHKPILYSYLIHTFGRLVLENKVVISASGNFAAFNTGLVDRRYEPIYALFRRQDDPRAPWQLAEFCTAGEGKSGQNLVRYFNPLPLPPHYFDEPADLLYDVRQGEPEISWRHVVIERIDRYPLPFLKDHWPAAFAFRDTTAMTKDERYAYFTQLGEAIERDDRLYRRIMNRVRDALDLCIKRVSWNFKTAVPQYYPPAKKLQLLLPLCLVQDDVVDLALAVERTVSGKYLAYTVLPLHWAYTNARLICRPDSDWLSPEEISAVEEVADEDEV